MEDFAILRKTIDGIRRIPDNFADTHSPKLKFNFMVRFNFRESLLSTPNGGELDVQKNYFAARQVGRPSPVINYEDANYYGLRTKIATRIDYSTINLAFYDDGYGRAHKIIEDYVRLISPLTREQDADMLLGSQTITNLPVRQGLGPIKNIEVLHFHKTGNTKYVYQNPKITNVTLDDLDATTSEVSTVAMTFVYDSFFIQT